MKIELETQIKAILEGIYEIEEIDDVPDLNDPRLQFGSRALSFEATVVYVQLRDMPQLLARHNEVVLAKIRMGYFYLIAQLAASLGGVARLADDDGIYAFFQGTTQESLNSAVKAAMKIKFMLSNDASRLKKMLDGYQALNFAMGVDDGKLLCAKLGDGQIAYGDLVWSGQAIVTAQAIAQLLNPPEHIGISELVYYNLVDSVKYNKGKGKTVTETPLEIWRPAQLLLNGQTQPYYHTSFFWTVS